MSGRTPADQALQAIEKAFDMVSALCRPRYTAGAREWMMSIPARPDYDPDLVIGDALSKSREVIAALQREVDELHRRLAFNQAPLLPDFRFGEEDS